MLTHTSFPTLSLPSCTAAGRQSWHLAALLQVAAAACLCRAHCALPPAAPTAVQASCVACHACHQDLEALPSVRQLISGEEQSRGSPACLGSHLQKSPSK